MVDVDYKRKDHFFNLDQSTQQVKWINMKTIVTIDIDRLRENLRNDDLGAYFGGGFGGALMEVIDIDSATPEELIQIAQDRGVDLRKYVIDD